MTRYVLGLTAAIIRNKIRARHVWHRTPADWTTTGIRALGAIPRDLHKRTPRQRAAAWANLAERA